ncbi:DJ-1/PfpI family protein [Maridesulfovibrio frigidus]|uniref:DJ-1/PfpI family protein n=1 Tax=Maridesulfovibrio frigidus TaxID=340956 RepID=UPI0004E1C406|nr:DJ-1/PfpI family protein [Maridesulfovibrio frigidus]
MTEIITKKSIGVVLFPGFELLDVFGPLEMFGTASEYFNICMVAENSSLVESKQGPKSLAEYSFEEPITYDILLVPGGEGTRREVRNESMLAWLRKQAAHAEYVTSVCTGSALLAKAGVLDGICATTNKIAFDWATSQGPEVIWKKQARWVEDGKFFTSSGVSAGIDMSLAIIQKMLGQETAEQIAIWAEYDWHRNASWDPFAKLCGLV